jgi:NADH-quinone oxidoreductase subunit M
MPSLSLAIWIPMVAGLLLIALPNSIDKVAKAFATVVSLFTLGISVGLITKFDSSLWRFQFSESKEWISSLGIGYKLGIDGISLWMVALTAFLGLVSVLISAPKEKSKAFFGLLLVLQSTLIGVFTSLDLVLFYVFFELSLIPVFMLILGWGTGDKSKAAIKYLGVLFAGSLLMLVGIIAVGLQFQKTAGTLSFDLVEIQAQVASGKLWVGAIQLQSFVFWGFLLAFLVKAPAVPVHTWLSDTYQSSPIGAIVAGTVLKVGTYGLFRFVLPLFPDAVKSNAVWVVLIGTIGVLYGGILAINQKNIHRMMAFSTVSHVGFILIGLFSLTHSGMVGAAFQQFNHGLASAAVFVLLGFLYQRADTQNFDDLGGLKRRMPIFATLFLVAMLANLGLPLTSGFIGEFLALMGTFQAGFAHLNGIGIGFAAAAGAGAICSAAYMLYSFQRIFYGKSNRADLRDVNSSELAIGGVFALLILILGVYPTLVLKGMDSSVLAANLMTNSDKAIAWQGGSDFSTADNGRTALVNTQNGSYEYNLYPANPEAVNVEILTPEKPEELKVGMSTE